MASIPFSSSYHSCWYCVTVLNRLVGGFSHLSSFPWLNFVLWFLTNCVCAISVPGLGQTKNPNKSTGRDEQNKQETNKLTNKNSSFRINRISVSV
jgi:hypothetical protein